MSEGYPDKGVFKKRNDRVWITRLRNRYTPFKDEGKNRQDKHVGEYAGCLNVLWLLKHILPPTASCVGPDRGQYGGFQGPPAVFRFQRALVILLDDVARKKGVSHYGFP